MALNSDSGLERMIDYIKEWLRLNEENQKAVKPLMDILEVLDWAKQTLDEMPDSARNSPEVGSVLTQFGRAYGSLIEYLPSPSKANVVGITRFLSATTSLTSAVIFAGECTIEIGASPRWVGVQLDAFTKIQERHKTIAKVRELIAILNPRNDHPPNIIDEYDLMIERGFYINGNSIDAVTSAGISMRNILEHIKGKLFALVDNPKKQKFTWTIMIERLAPENLTPIEKELLLSQEQTWDNLHSILSNMAKNRTMYDIKQIAVQLIMHLYLILSLLLR